MDEGFGTEPKSTFGLLATLKQIDESQTYDEASKKYHCHFPSIKGNYLGYYEDVVTAIRGNKDPVINPQDSRDGIRIIELARESQKKGATIKWS